VGDEVPSKAAPHYQTLLDAGQVVWGSLVQANTLAFEPGSQDLPGVVAYSPDPFFDDAVSELDAIAQRVCALNGDEPSTPDLARIAHLIRDETASYSHERLPDAIAWGREVYISTLLIHRMRLPTGYVTARFFPLLIHLARSPVVMILPLRYWCPALMDYWITGVVRDHDGEHEEPQPLVESPPSFAHAAEVRRAYLANPVQLTDEAATRVRSIMEQQDLPSGTFLRVWAKREGGQTHRAMEFSHDPVDPTRDLRTDCMGIVVTTDLDSAALLTGVVIDFKEEYLGAGFVFREETGN
jgi:iron-sulfur cluster assembly protein